MTDRTDDPMERAYNVLGVALGKGAPKGLVARAVKAAERIAELEADAKMDGLAHARQWRRLTSDQATWPANAQRILTYDGEQTETDTWWTAHAKMWLEQGWTHWLPLPEPPEETP